MALSLTNISSGILSGIINEVQVRRTTESWRARHTVSVQCAREPASWVRSHKFRFRRLRAGKLAIELLRRGSWHGKQADNHIIAVWGRQLGSFVRSFIHSFVVLRGVLLKFQDPHLAGGGNGRIQEFHAPESRYIHLKRQQRSVEGAGEADRCGSQATCA